MVSHKFPMYDLISMTFVHAAPAHAVVAIFNQKLSYKKSFLCFNIGFVFCLISLDVFGKNDNAVLVDKLQNAVLLSLWVY